MTEPRELQSFRQSASERIGDFSARTTAQAAGIDSLLNEGRASTFSLTTTQKDGKSILTIPTPFGNADFETHPEIKTIDATLNFDTNQLNVGVSARNSLTYLSYPDKPTVNAIEEARLDASVNVSDFDKPRGSLQFTWLDRLKHEDGSLMLEQKADCTLEVKSGAEEPVATCKGKLTDAKGKEYDYESKDTMTKSEMTVKSDGKTVGTVETETVKADDKPDDTEYKVKVKPAS